MALLTGQPLNDLLGFTPDLLNALTLAHNERVKEQNRRNKKR